MENPHYFTRLPESMELADIGPYFRSLREHYGLSEHDVSARLHIRVRYIQAIEESDVSQLPGKVYARGYISTYAEFLGIDPEQAVERLLGTETKEKPEEYFVPEPARLDSGLQQKLRLGLIALVVVGIFYALFSGPDTEDDSTVVPVPESLVESSRSLVMPTDKHLRCASGSVLSACLQVPVPVGVTHPLQHPRIFTAAAPWKPAPASAKPVAPAPAVVEAAPKAPAKPVPVKPAPAPKPVVVETPKPEAAAPAEAPVPVQEEPVKVTRPPQPEPVLPVTGNRRRGAAPIDPRFLNPDDPNALPWLRR